MTKRVCDVSSKSMPHQLGAVPDRNDQTGTPVENQSEGSLPFSTRRVLSMCYVQLDLVGTVKRLTDEYWSDLDDRDVLHLLKMLKDISVFAKQFNDNIRHRVKLMN